jgi:hypothetical protein
MMFVATFYIMQHASPLSIFFLGGKAISLLAGADLQGGWGGSSPPTADASMENREGEGEEVVEEKRKMERKRGRRRNQSP